MKSTNKIRGIVGILAVLGWAQANANVPVTADYGASPGASGTEDLVGPFTSLDLSDAGIALIKGAIGVPEGTAVEGYYQSFVTAHTDGTGTLPAPGLNTGYELTLRSSFFGTTGPGGSFNINSGNAQLYFDPTPDKNFSTDSGFDDSASILSASINGGQGVFSPPAGVGTLTFTVDSFDADVFTPELIGGDAIFTLELTTDPGTTSDAVRNGSNSVMGVNVVNEGNPGGDLLTDADGNVSLTAVPVPAAIWLFGAGLLGIAGIAPRRRQWS